MSMVNERIEPRLAAEIQRMESAGQVDREIPVIIEIFGQADQAGVVKRLSELGVKSEVRPLPLTNALETRLKSEQVRQIARHPDVKLLILNREEQVTTVS